MAYTTIDDPELYFQTKLYTGSGSSNALTFDGDTDMQPDLIWSKNREDTRGHNVTDAVRGISKWLGTNTSASELTVAEGVTAIGSDGFTVGTSNDFNVDGEGMVAWCWKAGTTSGLSGGGITPSGYSINATSGFGIYAYTGTGSAATITHGLGAVPKAMIIKKRNSATTGDWFFHHGSLASGNSLFLNSTNAQDTSDFLGTAPTSTVFTVNSDYANKSSDTYIAYVFAEVKGFSSMGSYVGNGNAQGPYCFCGFRPAFVLQKVYSTTSNWHLHDNKRGPFNPDLNVLYPNIVNAEGNDILCDFTANGFQIRSTTASRNGAGSTFVYVAFAEAPFVNSNGVPCNAR